MRYLIFYIAGILLLSSCFNTNGYRESGWHQLGNSIDSLTAALDAGFSRGFSQDEALELLRQMESVEDTCALAKARKLYWESMILARDSGKTVGFRILEPALNLVDSMKFPYDFLRITAVYYGEFHPATVVNYSRLLKSSEEYTKLCDTLMMIRSFNRLGQLLYNIGEHDQCMEYVEKALALAREGGYEMLELSQLNNKAAILATAGFTNEATEIMEELATSEKIKESKELYYDFCYNSAYFLKKPEYLAIAKQIYSAPRDVDRIYWIDYLSTLYYADNAQYVDSVTCVLWNARDSIEDNSLKKSIYYVYYRLQKANRNTAEALHALEGYEILHQDIEEGMNTFEIMSLDKRHEIDMFNRLSQSKIIELRLKLMIIILSIIIIILLSTYFLKRYINNVKKRQRQAQTEIEQNRLGLTASKLTLEEKDKVIDEINRRILNLEENGNLNHSGARQINNVIMIHRSGQEENENFIDMFSKVHPDFVSELHNRYPSITDSQVKLAMYLIMGLNSKQIARMLMIQPEAVKKEDIDFGPLWVWKLTSRLKVC